MALINCPECKKEISDQSVNCFSCGYPIREKLAPHSILQSSNVKAEKSSSFIGVITKILILIIGSFLVYKCVSPDEYKGSVTQTKSTSLSPENVEIETTASKMLATYEENETRGDAIYKGKVIKITGYVNSINSDLTDKAVVHLSPKDNTLTFSTVMASGDNNFHNQAINLNKGQKITLICKGLGEIIGSPNLDNCVFL